MIFKFLRCSFIALQIDELFLFTSFHWEIIRLNSEWIPSVSACLCITITDVLLDFIFQQKEVVGDLLTKRKARLPSSDATLSNIPNCLFSILFYPKIELLGKCSEFDSKINSVALRPLKRTTEVLHDSKNI